MTGTVKRRPYDSSRRQAQARHTRAAIITAAGRLFADGGYGPTTMEAIALEAGVAVQTVYAVFGTKAGVVAALRDDRLTGDDQPVAVRDRSWYADMLAAPDVADRLSKLAEGVTQIHVRTGLVNRLIRDAAGVDPDLAALCHLERRQRRQSLAPLAAALAHDLPDWDRDELLDTLWSLVSPELHELLVTERHWTTRHYQRWLTQTLSGVILRA
jgi:AcrR family transcriptional regulator